MFCGGRGGAIEGTACPDLLSKPLSLVSSPPLPSSVWGPHTLRCTDGRQEETQACLEVPPPAPTPPPTPAAAACSDAERGDKRSARKM